MLSLLMKLKFQERSEMKLVSCHETQISETKRIT